MASASWCYSCNGGEMSLWCSSVCEYLMTTRYPNVWPIVCNGGELVSASWCAVTLFTVEVKSVLLVSVAKVYFLECLGLMCFIGSVRGDCEKLTDCDVESMRMLCCAV